MRENNASTNCGNTDDDSDLEITGFIQVGVGGGKWEWVHCLIMPV